MTALRGSHSLAALSVALAAAVWGSAFPATKYLQDAGLSVGTILSLRFSIGAVALLALALMFKAPWRKQDLRDGFLAGLVLFALFWLQTDGLRFTTTTKNAFITGLYVIFTPLLSILLRLRRPSFNSFLGAALALSGLHLLTNPTGSGGGFGRGELLTLLCAVAFSGHLLAVDHYTRRFNRPAIAFLQVAIVGALGLAPALLIEPMRLVSLSRQSPE